MAYCTIQDVQDKGTVHDQAVSSAYDDTTVPTADYVQKRIAFRAAEIDSRLASVGVVVPVDPGASPRACALLAELNTLGAAGDALEVTYRRSSPEQSTSATHLLDEYKRLLKMYAGDGGVELAHDRSLKFPGNPSLLLDVEFTADRQMRRPKPWSRTRELHPFPEKDPSGTLWGMGTRF